MPNGGPRPGSGRPKGSRSKLSIAASDIAGQVLDEVGAKRMWMALLACGDPKVIADVMKYLTNRKFGMPRQQIETTVESRESVEARALADLLTPDELIKIRDRITS